MSVRTREPAAFSVNETVARMAGQKPGLGVATMLSILAAASLRQAVRTALVLDGR